MTRPGYDFYPLLAVSGLAVALLGIGAGLRGGLLAPAAWFAACGHWLVTRVAAMPPPLLVVLAGVGVVVLARAVGALVGELRRTRRAVGNLLARVYPGRTAGLPPHVDLIDSERQISFCYGYGRPRICISTAVVAAFDPYELGAVLLHEEYHRRRREPLKMLVAEVLARAFFFLPLLAALRQRYLWTKELAADRYAIARQGGPARLAGALLKVARQASLPPAAAAAGAFTLVEARIDRLTTGRALLGRPAAVSLLWLLVGLAVVWCVMAAATAGAATGLPNGPGWTAAPAMMPVMMVAMMWSPVPGRGIAWSLVGRRQISGDLVRAVSQHEGLLCGKDGTMRCKNLTSTSAKSAHRVRSAVFRCRFRRKFHS